MRNLIKHQWLNAMAGILTICAVVLTSTVCWRLWNQQSVGVKTESVQNVSDWRHYMDGGHWQGSRAAPIRILEFGDLQCPYCAQMSAVLDSVRRRHPGRVATGFRHFTLSSHKFALQAAQAAECAGRSGHFDEFLSVVFKRRAALGRDSWAQFAVQAGVRDSSVFLNCMNEPGTLAIILEDEVLGRKLQIHATPTTLINGKLVVGAMTVDRLERLIE